jgi:alginate O-acetyltransferase complex protein AlgI
VLFNSYVFLFVFLPLVFVGWWSIPSRNGRLVFLSVASCVFYGWWDYRFVPLMIISSSADYVAGRMIASTQSMPRRRLYLVLLLVFNLGLLGVFKYYDFVTDTLNRIGQLAGRDPALPLLGLVLPVGISFYTFNSISYTIDVYRGRVEPARSFIDFSTFVVMFPHLVAGPIVRYSDMGDQFAALPKRARAGELLVGTWFLVLGLAKKVLIADVLAESFVTPLFAESASLKLAGSWIATLAYTFQIYFDFSGYSDMAVGLAFFLGLHFPQNFDSPYKSANISEFWRRWHMSLSFWLRDYLFIPLGGSRGTKLATVRNLALTMFLGGLWHGASWTFVIWGLYHGALLAAHSVLKDRGLVPRFHFVSVGLTFVCVMFGWVVFRAPTIGVAREMFEGMFGFRGFEGLRSVSSLLAGPGALVLALAGFVAFLAPSTWEIEFPRTRLAGAVLAIALAACVLRFATPSPFLYFQF